MQARASTLATLLLVFTCLFGGVAVADDSQPGFLELKEAGANRFRVLWRAPKKGGKPLPLKLQLPSTLRDLTPPVRHELPGSVVERRLIETDADGLIGERIEIAGLQAISATVIVRVQFANGTTTTTVLKPDQPWMLVKGPLTSWQVAWEYTVLGVEHILIGYDHLLFVLALLFIVGGNRRLLATITAFTIAHSITLVAATLGLVWLPDRPVEATIALSIIFLASELVKIHRGQPSMTARYPWVVAFCFGLLHGLGFAGALSDIGLPQHEIPLALLMFNVGVELGQLLFVGMVLVLMFFLSKIRIKWPEWVREAPAYGIGSMAAFWFVERLSSF